jgi:hypothetical protein
MDCIAVWPLWERIRIVECKGYIAVAPLRPNLEGTEKVQLRTLAWHRTRFKSLRSLEFKVVIIS